LDIVAIKKEKMNRRHFTKTAGFCALSLTGLTSACKNGQSTKLEEALLNTEVGRTYKLSLAQWSLNRAIKDGSMDPFSFAAKAKSLGFEGLEYVNGLYEKHLETAKSPLAGVKSMTHKLLKESKAAGMENVLIMIDGEGDLGIHDQSKRLEGVENHKKWIDAAHALGCQSIRLNLFGDGRREEQVAASSDSMRRLGEYAKDMSINVLVENHGGLSSDPHWVLEIMKNVNMNNVGTLPDFGNFCIEREGGERWDAPCINEYKDIYEAVKLMMPYAKAVSAKSYAFDEAGKETTIDYYKMIQIVKDSGYKGFIGVEFEGETDADAGILATKALILKSLA